MKFKNYIPFPNIKAYLLSLGAKHGITESLLNDERRINHLCELGKEPVWASFRDNLPRIFRLDDAFPKVLFTRLAGDKGRLDEALARDKELHLKMASIKQVTAWGFLDKNGEVKCGQFLPSILHEKVFGSFLALKSLG